MDPERWPQTVHKTVGELTCPRCGEPRHGGRKGIFVIVRYLDQTRTWNINAECMECHQAWFWNLVPTTEQGIADLAPKPEPSPEQKRAELAHQMTTASTPVVAREDKGAASTPLPSWLSHLGDLPPGGGEAA